MTLRPLPVALSFVLMSGFALAGAPAAESPAAPVHARDAGATFRGPYRDDADGRRIAALEVFVPGAADDGAALRLVVSAVGPEVDPVSGYEGVAGANRFTAEQFARIVTGSRRFTIVARDLATGATSPGRIYAGAYGTIPQRRLRADGTIDYLAESVRPLPLDLRLEAGPFAAGRHEVQLTVDGEPRLRLTLTRSATGATTIEYVQGLGAGGAARPPGRGPGGPLFLTQLVGPPPPRERVPGPPPVDAAEWATRDMEGKWAFYDQDVARHPESGPRWVQFLADEKDYAFLEWIAIYQQSAFSSLGVGMTLAEARAPQWARVGVWMRHDPTGHGHLEAQAILGTHPGQIRWWLQRYPEAAPGLAKQWADHEPVEAPELLPPLTPEAVYGLLDAPPAELSDFGAGQLKAEPGQTYVQQVVRAIRGFAIAGRPGEPWEPKLRALTRHADATVRREAYLAYTHGRFKPMPREEVLRAVDDPAERASVREAAALAFSYERHPAVYVKLHGIAADPAHAAWPAAVSRLGDLGDGFTVAHLDRLGDALTPAQRRLVVDSVKRIKNRTASEDLAMINADPSGRKRAGAMLSERLRNAAWAEQTGDPLAATLVPWLIETTREQAEALPNVRLEVMSVAGDGPARDAGRDVKLDDKSMEARVRQLARRVRDALTPAEAAPGETGNPNPK